MSEIRTGSVFGHMSRLSISLSRRVERDCPLDGTIGIWKQLPQLLLVGEVALVKG